MKPKIKIRLEVWGSSLVMQVLEMDERFRRGGLNSPNDYLTRSGIKISSWVVPALDVGGVYLFGSQKEYDNGIGTRLYNSNREAEEKRTDILLALKEWANNWEGFKEDKVEETNNDGNIYTF